MIPLPEAVLDRLKAHGHGGIDYPEILTALMDRVERDDFVQDLRQQFLATPPSAYVDLDDL